MRFVHLLALFAANPFRSRRWVEIENLFLRHQLNISLRRSTMPAVFAVTRHPTAEWSVGSIKTQ
jgi:hypothetical protein